MAPALVLLHGFTHTGASWDGVVAALGERYRALAPDIRGHGSASDRRPVSLHAVLDDLSGIPVERFTLAGYSMGGRLALHAALAMPERVERLVLIGAGPGIDDVQERRARRAADEDLASEIEHSTIEAFAERWAATPVLAGQPDSVRAATRTDRLRNTPGGLAAALRGLGTGALPAVSSRLGELEMPVVLLAGERDAKFSEIARGMARAIRGARLRIVPGAGHAVHLEASGEVASILAG